MKKKIVFFLLFILCIAGCGNNEGSFEKGTKDIPLIYQLINANIAEKEWDMALLNDAEWGKKDIEELYQIDMTRIKEAYVKSAVVASQICEIAFFKADKGMDAMLQKGISYRLSELEKQWGTYNPECKNLIKEAKQGRIGQYYYFIIGEDCKKVVNYIQNMSA